MTVFWLEVTGPLTIVTFELPHMLLLLAVRTSLVLAVFALPFAFTVAALAMQAYSSMQFAFHVRVRDDLDVQAATAARIKPSKTKGSSGGRGDAARTPRRRRSRRA